MTNLNEIKAVTSVTSAPYIDVQEIKNSFLHKLCARDERGYGKHLSRLSRGVQGSFAAALTFMSVVGTGTPLLLGVFSADRILAVAIDQVKTYKLLILRWCVVCGDTLWSPFALPACCFLTFVCRRTMAGIL